MTRIIQHDTIHIVLLHVIFHKSYFLIFANQPIKISGNDLRDNEIAADYVTTEKFKLFIGM